MVVALAVATANDALADNNHRVILLRPLVTDEIATEAQARVRGELSAAGFEVIVIAQEPGVQLRDGVETAGRFMSALAAYAIRTETTPTGSIAEIFVSDRLRNKLLTEKSVLDRKDPGHGAAVLAVQAVELLKASLADYWLGTPEPPALPPPQPPVAETPSPITLPEAPPAAALVGIEMGITVLEHFGKSGGALLPSVKISVAPEPWLAVRLSAGGLGPGNSVEAPAGTAAVEQEIGALELVASPLRKRWGSVFLAAGGGVYHLHLVGTGVDPYVGRLDHAWAAMMVAGLGLRADVTRRVAAVAEVQGVALLPPPEIRFADTLLGRVGQPSLLAGAGILASF
jgi:hypothetical protein